MNACSATSPLSVTDSLILSKLAHKSERNVTIQESDPPWAAFAEALRCNPARTIKGISVIEAAVQALDVAQASHRPGSRLGTFLCQLAHPPVPLRRIEASAGLSRRYARPLKKQNTTEHMTVSASFAVKLVVRQRLRLAGAGQPGRPDL
jgi:hypothetical protein